ncbi:MAG: hypothetical protein R2838_21450 [Caldilineaceae bacterium]
MLLNFRVIHNYEALGFDGSTALENRGMISNTGILVLSGETYNGAPRSLAKVRSSIRATFSTSACWTG